MADEVLEKNVIKITFLALEEMAFAKLVGKKVPSFDSLVNNGYGKAVGVTAGMCRGLIRNKFSDLIQLPSE